MFGIFNYTFMSLFYISLLMLIYFSKKRIRSIETRMFSELLICTFTGILLAIASYYTICHNDTLPILNIIVSKLYIIYLLTWITLFTLYTINISTIKASEKYHKYINLIFLLLFVVFSIAVLISPLNFNTEPNKIYSYGLSANISIVVGLIYASICTLVMLFNFKNVHKKKYLPLFAYIFFGVAVVIIQKNHPEFLLVTSMEAFVTFLMYFTIENPDMKMIAELNAAKDAADRANQAKSDFLSSMSHEIRTPLNAIVGFSESLKEENLDPQATDEVNDIISASNTLLELVNGILDISKIEANKIELVNNQYSFRKVFNDLVALSKARLGDKPLEFRYKYDESIPEVLYGDSTRVKQVILNLLTNSIKYTKEGYFELKVSSIINNNICRLIISVEDSGIGIKKENINKLFNKFERLDEKNTTIEGTGLGLAITKKLVDLMHGKIVVQSIYNKGSKFTIALDQRVIDAPAKPIEVTNTEYIKKDFTGKKILVVDDNNLNLKVASRLLAPYNCIVETVSSGTECIDKIASNNKYDLILLDDMMPHLSGVDTLHRLKENENFKIPTIALTANAIDGMREKYLNDGFDDYLAKPIEKRELERILNHFLN